MGKKAAAVGWRNRVVALEYHKPDELADHPKQWKRHGERQLAALRGVLGEVGIAGALHAWRSERNEGRLTVWDGHGRKSLDSGQLWSVLVTDLTDEEADKLLLLFDPIGALAAAEPAKLEELLRGIAFDDEDLTDFLEGLASSAGIVLGEESPLAEVPAPVERAVELRRKWKTKLGQLWEIPSGSVPGRAHRLLCGDSTDPDTVERLMGDERATLFATDPPYLVDYDGMNHPSKAGKRDIKTNEDLSDAYHDWDRSEQGEGLYDGFIGCALAHAVLPDAAWYCWHASRRQAMVEAMWRKHGAFVHQQIIWVKDRPIMTRSWYLWQHEPCLFGWMTGQKPKRVARDYPNTVWTVPTVQAFTSTDHPTTKPVELFAIPIRQHTRKGGLCYEPFAGSGTQIVAAEQLGRVCYAMELAPEFVAVTLERLASMGLKPKVAGKA